MKIAVLGAGAMGMLIGGSLSTANQVTLIDVNETVTEKIQRNGVVIHEKDGSHYKVYPRATVNTLGIPPVDLMIVFVKAMYSREALRTNRALIGPDTYLMTLQNGAGHEDTLLEFVDEDHIIIGTTQHNSSACGLGEVLHGGAGHTYIGSLAGDAARLQPVADAFNAAGLPASINANVKKLIWSKLFTNVSASVLTGVLQCPLGFIEENMYAWAMCQRLVEEAVNVANGDGHGFDKQKEIEAVRQVCLNAPGGFTSIYADLAAGRLSEVDTISGSVVKASRRNGVPAPAHAFIVEMVHAMEQYNRNTKE